LKEYEVAAARYQTTHQIRSVAMDGGNDPRPVGRPPVVVGAAHAQLRVGVTHALKAIGYPGISSYEGDVVGELVTGLAEAYTVLH
jgi:hypothetical protein